MQARAAVLLFLTVSLAPALPARALTLDDVRKSLAAYQGTTPLDVRIDSVQRRLDGKEKSESSGSSLAEDDGKQLRMVHDKGELRKKALGKKNRADSSVSAAEALKLMNYAPHLLKELEGATLKKVTPTTLDGAPATLLEIVPLREKDEDGDKWVKSYSDTLLLWVGPGSVPLSMERTLKVKARIVVLGLEWQAKEKMRFQRSADRLVVTRMSDESSGSGLGTKEDEAKTATVTILR